MDGAGDGAAEVEGEESKDGSTVVEDIGLVDTWGCTWYRS